MDQESILENQSDGSRYSFNGEMLVISAIITVFLFVVLLVGLHLYARWYLRRAAASRRTRILVFADNHRPGSAADRGLDPSVLASLPVLHFSSKAAAEDPDLERRRSAECAVCISEFEEDEAVRLLPKCNHSFHIDCIDMWFHSHSTCPLCRSPVEPAADRIDPSPVVVVVEVAEGVSGPDSGSSSGSGLCETCQHHEGSSAENAAGDPTASLVRRRKADGAGFSGVKIDVGPPRRAELEGELAQSSPMGRLLSFKRLLSMGRRSPAGGMKSPYGPGPSRGPSEMDVESGLGAEGARAHTPK